MRIETLRGSYQIICTLEGASEGKAYLCGREDTSERSRFIVQGVYEPGLCRRMTSFFLESSVGESVPEFEESFLWNGGVWSAFRCEEGVPWEEWTKEEVSFAERLDAASELMEKLFASQLPAYLQYEAGNPENIVWSRQAGVGIRFLLREPRRLGSDVYGDMQQRVGACLWELLGSACGRAPQELKEFLGKMQRMEFRSDGELYYAYRRLEEALRLAEEEGRLAKENILLGWWGRFFAQRTNVLQFLYCLVIGTLCGVLLSVCIVPSPVSGEQTVFRSIGTLQIIDYDPIPEDETEGDTEQPEDTEEPETESEAEDTEEPTESPRELG